ncbi:MAG TPA: DUF1990 domain-containing protein [Naasia sp.]|jgi:uncharacterized protein (UPF0548 family)
MTRRHLRLTYPEQGATRDAALPQGYSHLTSVTDLGSGAAAFALASSALLSWQMHRGAGVAVQPPGAGIAPGVRVTLRWGFGPVRVSAPCEVLYLVDEEDRGFAYGTLTGHPEVGEERFTVEHRQDDSVVLVIGAFSRPGPWWSRAAAPLSRAVQHHIVAAYGRSLKAALAAR